MVGLNLSQSVGERSYDIIMGNGYNCMLWCPTARYKAGYGGDSKAARSASTVFWKGVSEKVHIESDTSDPWLWRRIIFEWHGGFDVDSIPFEKYYAAEADVAAIPSVPGSGANLQNVTSMAGVTRTNRPMESLTSEELTFIWGVVFKGQRYMDWLDPTTAPVNNSDLKVHSDRTRTMRSGNDASIFKNYSMYVPLNKTMSYDDQESGSLERASALSDRKSPLKDVFILDLFAQSALAPGKISFRSTATAYWHEK